MKLKALLTGLVALSLIGSAAIAAPPPGKGKPTTGPGCKPKITVVLKGTLKTVSALSLGVEVKSGNRWGRAYVNGPQPVAIGVGLDTKVRRQGLKTVGDLKPEDRVLVQARVCKEDLKDDLTPALTASKVIAHPAKAASEETDTNDD